MALLSECRTDDIDLENLPLSESLPTREATATEPAPIVAPLARPHRPRTAEDPCERRERARSCPPMSSSSPDAAREVSVAACSAEDRAEQTRLFNACFKKRVDERALVWRYDENPHGRALSFVSRPAGGEGVSGYACSPRIALSFGDEASRAVIGETGDVMTHPEWRKRGLFSALDRACMEAGRERGWPLVFGLPNRRSAHIFLELGWEQVGTLRPWTFVLRSDARARRERAKDGRMASWLTPFAMRRGRAARGELVRASGIGRSARPRSASGVGESEMSPSAGEAGRVGRVGVASAEPEALRASELASFSKEVEALSRGVEKRFALMVRRDAAYLDWRFAKSPSGLHRSIGIYAASGELAGYCVVQLPREGECVGYLVDVLARDDATVAAAIESGIARLEAAGASLVQATAIDGSWWSDWLERAGFVRPKPHNHLIVIAHVNDREHPLAKAARDASKWYLTDGDRDDETMG
jgi:GNAT superfamily N-acetyltransferase